MARVRKIVKNPKSSARNYFVVDACFLVNKYLNITTEPNTVLQDQIRQAHLWWKEIDRQIANRKARVYIPDLCIAEAFKVLASKYYQDRFGNYSSYNHARNRLQNDVSIGHKDLQKKERYIGYHDVSASRDIIVSVGRFYEVFHKKKCNVGVIDLILVSTAKYLMDFHDAPKDQIHIITHDKKLWQGIRGVSELPNAYDPSEERDSFAKVFSS